MKKSPGLFTLVFTLGIICTHIFKVCFWPIYILAGILLFACVMLIKKVAIFNILILALVFLLGILCLKNAYTPAKSDIARYAHYGDETLYTIKGFVDSYPTIKGEHVSFIVRAEELQFDNRKYSVSGNILVYSSAQIRFSYGEELILFGKIEKPYRQFKSNISALVRLKNSAYFKRLSRNKGNLFKRTALYIKCYVEEVFAKRLSSLSSGINKAMILGEKGCIPPAVYDRMVKTGTIHIMVVSGFHVGVIAFISGFILKVLRIPKKVRYCGIMACLVIYCLIAGASTPVVRATIMGIFIIVGYFLQRDPNITSSFFLAMLFILVNNPKDLFTVSFQLSFASVAGILFLYPLFKKFFKLDKVKTGFIRLATEGFSVSLSAWLATCIFIFYYFKMFSWVAILANIFIVPLASLIILSGLSLFLISIILPSVAGPVAVFNEAAVFMLLKLNAFFVSLPFAYVHM